MKKKFTLLALVLICQLGFSQFTTGTVSLPATGMTVKIDVNATTVTLTLTGSSTAWLGIGFNAVAMGDLPDVFVYNNTTNRDYNIFGYVTPTADAVQNWTVSSNTITSGTRTIVASRPLAGDAGDYLFTNAAGNLNIIYAMGSSLSFAKHIANDTATLTFAPILAVDDVTKLKNSFRISQNPVGNMLTFEFDGKVKSAKIYDPSGKLLKSFASSEKFFEVANLKSGNYYLEIESENNGSFFQKFIKK